MIVWLTKINGKLRLSDKKIIFPYDGEPITIGFPEFQFSLEPLIDISNNNFDRLILLKEGQSKKMVLKEWPIE